MRRLLPQAINTLIAAGLAVLAVDQFGPTGDPLLAWMLVAAALYALIAWPLSLSAEGGCA